ncbi:MAG: hypothetical protein ACK58Q_14065 [Chitinophagales bacterium]
MKNKITIEAKRKKVYAIFLLILLFSKHVVLFATPGGPTQPEAESFKPIGVSDHVNKFNGAFTYTIPLMDVDGFPINLNYSGNPSLEGDASWVGLGWDLNLGSINRQLRGVPDEFDGTDKMGKTYKVKDNNTYGVKFNFNVQLANFEKLKRSLSLGLDYGIYYNNYRGMKTELSVSPSFNATNEIKDEKTGQIKQKNNGNSISLSVNSSSESCLELVPTVNLAFYAKNDDKKERCLGGASIGLPMSAREGIKGLNYGFKANYKLSRSVDQSDGSTKYYEYNGKFKRGGSISFVGPATPPFAMNPMENESYALTLNGGGDAWTVDFGAGALGMYTSNKVSQRYIERPMYGYFNLEKGTGDELGLMDFQREKDIPYQSEIPIIGIPQANYDLFSVNQPSTSSQFRAFRTTSGIFKDPKVENTTISHNLGGEVHGGSVFEAGGTLTNNFGGTTSSKWNNAFCSIGDFLNYSNENSPLKETVIIKSQNEISSTNEELYLHLGQSSPINLSVGSFSTGSSFLAKDQKTEFTFPRLPIEPDYSKSLNTKKFTRGTLFSYLTTKERMGVGLDKKLYDAGTGLNLFETNPNKYKAHHISEITVTNPDGSRAIYGLPLYNDTSREVNFSMPYRANYSDGFISYTAGEASEANGHGTEALYSSEGTPAYPHTWMMTGLVSADYADLHGDGITDDDRGVAHKINYSLKNPNYVWRIPAHNTPMMATFNPGLESDLKDDKASFSEGSREEWYVHSVESKNKIAIFVLEPRKDACGSNLLTGGKNILSKKYRVKQIKLYAKEDWNKNGSNAELIKSVNFEYDETYPLCPGVPNTDGVSGKLTLKKVSFAYGSSSRSQVNAYSFEYNNANYAVKAMDRWGNYKTAADNPNGLPNHDFPYSTQDKTKANNNAAAWWIKSITLPSGGKIEVNYESNTYAFVQNKRASYMTPILGVGATENGPIDKTLYKQTGTDLGIKLYQNMNYVFFEFDKNAIPKSVEEMKSMYFTDGQNLEYANNLYYRVKANLTKRGGQMRKEYIPGYAEIEGMGINKNNPSIGWIKLREVEWQQPFAFSAWQFLKSSNPKLAYPYNDPAYTGPLAAVLGMSSFMGNIREMLEGYSKVAKGYNIAQTIEPTQSYIRLLKPDMIKYGGGTRVSKILINDDWANMSGAGKTNTYGQEYKYEAEYNGKTISSGVAEYEPLLGNDENSLKKPINYSGAMGLLAPTSLYYVDEPIGENFYPAPTVGYSKVSVRSIHSNPTKPNGSGYQEYEYYTAKDFPVKTDRTHLGGPNVNSFSVPFLASFIKILDYSSVKVAQGFSVEVNDMHGKPKSEKNYNQKGVVIAETNYKYWVDDENRANPNLVNEIPTIDHNNNIENTLMGVNFDFYNDLRQSVTKSTEFSLELGGGMFPLGFLPGFFVVPLTTFGHTVQEYKSAATMKYVHRKGFLRRTEKFQDGSKITTENQLWDKNTGEVLVSSVQNEFDKPIYNLNIPAYWKYDGMGFGFKNTGAEFFVRLDTGRREISDVNPNSNMQNILYPGDEVEYSPMLPINISNPTLLRNKKYWVVKDFITNKFSLVDEYGSKITDYTPNPLKLPYGGKLKIVRSGRRNQFGSPLFSASMLENPTVKGGINIDASRRILNASANTYSDDWKIVSNYKEKVNDSCCNEEKWYAKINKIFNDRKANASSWLCPLNQSSAPPPMMQEKSNEEMKEELYENNK